VTAQVVSATDAAIEFIAPPGAVGPVTLVVMNAAGESVEVQKAFEYVESVDPDSQ
jgi:UDP-N-acetylenolpyruvoylglucosamine reductase